MNWLKRCWQLLAMAMGMAAFVIFSAATRVSSPDVAPLPGPLSIKMLDQKELRSAPKRAIFPKSLSEPIAPPTTETASELPILVGIAGGKSIQIALLKKGEEQTVRVHTGEVMNGWTIRSITSEGVVIRNVGGERYLELGRRMQ